MDIKNFYVIVPVSNHIRYQSRDRLFRDFESRMKLAGINLMVVELAFGDRPFQYTESGNPLNVQLRTSHELWHKENMINIAVSRLPLNWEYVAWVDADIMFTRPDWALETVQQLQHYKIVQMFETAIDMGPSGEALNTFQSFASCYVNGLPYSTKSDQYGSYGYGKGSIYWHPGFAWAARRDAFNEMGCLIDKAILGAADHHMSMCLINKGLQSIPSNIHSEYVKYISNWQANAERTIRRNIGYVPGTIVHFWHGKKVDRRYWDRWKILIDKGFNPAVDLSKDSQGLYQLVDDGSTRIIKLRDAIRSYFRARNEDSIDLV